MTTNPNLPDQPLPPTAQPGAFQGDTDHTLASPEQPTGTEGRSTMPLPALPATQTVQPISEDRPDYFPSLGSFTAPTADVPPFPAPAEPPAPPYRGGLSRWSPAGDTLDRPARLTSGDDSPAEQHHSTTTAGIFRLWRHSFHR